MFSVCAVVNMRVDHLQGRLWDDSQMKKRTPLGSYRRPLPRVLGVSSGGGRFRMAEVPV